MQDFSDHLGHVLLDTAGNALVVALIIIVVWLAYRLLVRVVRTLVLRAAAAPQPGEAELDDDARATRRAERRRRFETVAGFGLRLVRWLAVAIIVLVAVSAFLPSAWAALGGLGVGFGVAVGGAIGFGTQQLVRDYLNGMLILGENPYSVGDVIAIAGVSGTVEEVGLRRTVIRDFDGAVHSVPNGAIWVASNFTRQFARVNERFLVAYGTDIAQRDGHHRSRRRGVRGRSCLGAAAASTRRAVLRVDPVVDPGIPILVSFRVRPGEQWAVGGELRRRVISALVGEGIRLATSQRLQVDAPLPIPTADAEGAESGADFT